MEFIDYLRSYRSDIALKCVDCNIFCLIEFYQNTSGNGTIHCDGCLLLNQIYTEKRVKKFKKCNWDFLSNVCEENEFLCFTFHLLVGSIEMGLFIDQTQLQFTPPFFFGHNSLTKNQYWIVLEMKILCGSHLGKEDSWKMCFGKEIVLNNYFLSFFSPSHHRAVPITSKS